MHFPVGPRSVSGAELGSPPASRHPCRRRHSGVSVSRCHGQPSPTGYPPPQASESGGCLYKRRRQEKPLKQRPDCGWLTASPHVLSEKRVTGCKFLFEWSSRFATVLNLLKSGAVAVAFAVTAPAFCENRGNGEKKSREAD